MTDEYTPSTPSAAEAGAVFENLSEADASAVLDSLSSAGDDAAGATPVEVIPGLSSLDEALQGADLAQMTDVQIRDFESGDPERVEAALAAYLRDGDEATLAKDHMSPAEFRREMVMAACRKLEHLVREGTIRKGVARVLGLKEWGPGAERVPPGTPLPPRV